MWFWHRCWLGLILPACTFVRIWVARRRVLKRYGLFTVPTLIIQLERSLLSKNARNVRVWLLHILSNGYGILNLRANIYFQFQPFSLAEPNCNYSLKSFLHNKTHLLRIELKLSHIRSALLPSSTQLFIHNQYGDGILFPLCFIADHVLCGLLGTCPEWVYAA